MQFCCLFSSFLVHFKDLLMTEHRFSFCFAASWHFTALIYYYIIDLCPIDGYLFLIFCYHKQFCNEKPVKYNRHFCLQVVAWCQKTISIQEILFKKAYCNKGRGVITVGGILQLEDIQTSKSQAEKGYSFTRKVK